MKSLEQGHSDDIRQRPIGGAVACEVGVEICILEKLAGLGGRCIDEKMFGGLILESIYKRGYRNVGAHSGGVVDRFLVPVTDLIAVVEIQFVARLTCVGVLQIGRYRF